MEKVNATMRKLPASIFPQRERQRERDADRGKERLVEYGQHRTHANSRTPAAEFTPQRQASGFVVGRTFRQANDALRNLSVCVNVWVALYVCVGAINFNVNT